MSLKNAPSKTGNKSGGGRGNAPSKRQIPMTVKAYQLHVAGKLYGKEGTFGSHTHIA